MAHKYGVGWRWAGALLAIPLSMGVAIAQPATPPVTVSGGAVTGVAMADGSTVFQGIPYAASPSGANRWRPPAPRAPWPGVFDATRPAPACVQADAGWNQSFIAGAQEDCLTVSIRTPAPAAKTKLPVLVYIHGGSNAAGGAGDLADDALHREGIVVVKLQYRLGAFGFLGLDALRAEDLHASSANYGLLDQIAALRWVRDNIAAFGGDADNVTISGNSAGATDALFLTYSPLARGLFRRAILQSAAPGAPRAAAHSEAMGNVLLNRLHLPHGAAGLAALRALPADAINAAALNLPTSPGVDPSFTWEQQSIDGHVLPHSYPAGADPTIAILIGSNTEELGADRSATAAEPLLRAAFGDRADAARPLYRATDPAAPGSITTRLLTDMWFRCPSRWLAGRLAGAGAPVWRYEFGYGAPASGKPPEHTTEMDYVYHAPPAKTVAADWPPVQRYWANFIRHGNPNGPGLPRWPAVADDDASLSITPAGIAAVHGARAAQCDLMFDGRDHPPSAIAPPDMVSTVNVTGGAIAGVQADGLAIYLGIPYAAPPVGELRWRAPQAVAPWPGVRDARHFGAACAQTAQWVTHAKREDCLYLNVWAPARSATPAERLPVLVWLHGGGYYGGTAAQDGFNGANLARHGAVVVTLNYRLGVFGFFSHPELSREAPYRVSGNQGILDQIAALRWVKDNIAAFGGDPARVTIMGESAGGESVAVLVATPLAKGLFQRAIAQSGNDALPLHAGERHRFADLRAAEATGLAYARHVGAPSLAALRALPVETLHRQPWLPRTILDGRLLRDDLATLYRHHRQNDVPLLVGWNAEEGKDLAPEILGTNQFTAANHRQLLEKLLGRAPSAAVLAAYPGATDAEARRAIDRVTNDWWGWRMAQWAQLQQRYGKSRAYVYYFAHQPAPPLTPCGYGCGAGHGAEIPYVFDNLAQDDRPWTTADRQLAATLAATWVRFARTGDPNGPGLPAWRPYDGTNGAIRRIGDDATLQAYPLPDLARFR